MSYETSIRVSQLIKNFPVYAKPHHRLMQMLSIGQAKHRWFREFQALKDIDFEIKKGETVGIVGRNGSGKSTLLQIICGTLSPSSGTVEVNGRIAALLELGAGFNPDFTGAENIFMNGTLLGLKRSEIESKYEEILAFADIGDFIDQPVKSYSSGMYIRLAFAVAINVMPDILVVDEALSVGDEAFQRKCFARIEKIRADGATILFVSHSAGTILELCNRAIMLDHGEMLAIGAPKHVVSRYQKMLYAPADMVSAMRERFLLDIGGESMHQTSVAAPPYPGDVLAAGRPEQQDLSSEVQDAYFDPGLQSQSMLRFEPRGAHIQDPHLETLGGQRINVLRSGSEYIYTYVASFDQVATLVRFGMLIKSISGLELGGATSSNQADALEIVEPGASVRVSFRFRCLLAPGTYFMNAGIRGRLGEEETFLDRLMDAALFRVMPDPGRLATGFVDFQIRSLTEPLGVENAK